MTRGAHGASMCRRAIAPERGSGTPELVIIVPVLFLVVTLSFQLALWALAAHALSASVAEGGAALRSQGGTIVAARATVSQELQAVARNLVGHPSVSLTILPGGFEAITASASVPSVFPDLHLVVSATSAGPAEGFRAAG